MSEPWVERYLDRREASWAAAPGTAEGDRPWSPWQREEARRHLVALIEAYEELGCSRDEAIAAAVRQFEAEFRREKVRDRFPTFRSAARRLGGAWRRTRAALPAVAALLLFVYVGTNVAAGRALERMTAEIRGRGEPLTGAEVAPPAVRDAENAALLYDQAFQRLPRLDHISEGDGRERVQLAGADAKVIREFLAGEGAGQGKSSLARIDQALAGTGEALDLTRRAAAMPECRFPVDWTAGAGALFPHLPKMRSLVGLMAAHAKVTAMRGDAAAAMADIEAAAGMARHLGQEPALISQLVQYACLATTRRALNDVLAAASPQEADCRRLYQALAALDPYGAFERGLYGERCLGVWVFDTVRSHPSALRQLVGDEGGPTLQIPFLATSLGRPLLKWDEVCYLRAMNRQIEQARQRGRMGPAHGSAPDLVGVPKYAWLTRFVLPAFYKAADRRDQTAAGIAVAQSGLALQVYRERTGRYPASLGDASSAAGWKLPEDPFTGKPLRYRRTEQGFLLYSVGVNGRDDDGRNRNGRGLTVPPSLPPGDDDIAWRVGEVDGARPVR